MAPSGAPQTATWPRPSTPHADDRTTMPAFVSSRLITAGGVPPPVHCTEPRDLNTILLAGGFASLPKQQGRSRQEGAASGSASLWSAALENLPLEKDGHSGGHTEDEQ